MEARRTALGAAAFFLVLAGYYLLRPLRDELGVRGGVEHLDWLFSATFVAMLLGMLGYAWLSARVSRRRLVPALYGLVAASLIAFRALGAEGSMLYARTLFVWISVINLFLVSGFWSVMSDSFDSRAAARRFGLVAAGGTAGALLGPAGAGMLARFAVVDNLLVAGATCVLLAGGLLYAAADPSAAREPEPVAPRALAGLGRLVSDARLRGLGLLVVAHAVVATLVYLLQARLVAEHLPDSSQRVQLFAGIDFSVNGIALLVQLGLTGALLTRLGVVPCIVVLPVVAIVGFAGLSLWPALPVVVVMTVLTRAANFAVTKPSRELLFTWLPVADRYRARAAMDTVLYRASDVVGAWSVTALSALGLGVAGIAACGAPLAVAWSWLSARTAARIRAGAPSETLAREEVQRGVT